jgi:BlaI family transcriptional regulator, penicillinase repressor
MPRPKQQQPTPGELEVLKILWDRGPSTVREVMDVLNQGRRRAYTSVMSLLEVMTEKWLLKRRPAGRAFVYSPAVDQDGTLSRIVEDMVGRVFEGSASALVAHLLGREQTSPEELEAIQKLIEHHQSQGRNP